MSTFWILLEQMELFVIYILAGVILVKSRLFNRETLQPISKFVLRMGLPLLIFTNIINGVERNVLLSSGSVLMLAFLFYVAMFFISMGIARIFHVKGKMALTRCYVYRHDTGQRRFFLYRPMQKEKIIFQRFYIKFIIS